MKKALILLIFLLTGCYNYQELNNLAIVEYASIDFEDNSYVLNFVINENKEEKEIPTILEGKGLTITDAIAEMNLTSSKELYTGHMLLYVISEDVARNGISEITDYFFRNPHVKKTFQIVIAKDNKAKEIIKSLSYNDTFHNNSITKNLTSETSLSSFVINTTLLSFIKKIKDPGIETIASGLKIDNEIVKFEPLAIFKDDKFVKWENEEISSGITILFNQSKSAKISSKCNDKNVIFLINNVKVKKEFIINDKINYKINVTGDAEISEMNCNYDLKNINDLNTLENILNNNLTNIFNKTIEEIKNLKIDSIGLGNYIYQKDYSNWLKIKDNYLENLNVKINTNFKLLHNENVNEGTININE